MAIIWNNTAQPDSFPIELSEDKEIENVIKDAEDDEAASVIIQEIEAVCSFTAGKGFGRQ